jgi:hypothetical protein
MQLIYRAQTFSYHPVSIAPIQKVIGPTRKLVYLGMTYTCHVPEGRPACLVRETNWSLSQTYEAASSGLNPAY